jgi:hypothetical protein
MSRAQGFTRLVSAGYVRIKPNLCPYCAYFKHYRNNKSGWHECVAKDALLSNPHSLKGRCVDFKEGGQRLDDAEIEELKENYLDWKEVADRVKARGTFMENLIRTIEDKNEHKNI